MINDIDELFEDEKISDAHHTHLILTGSHSTRDRSSSDDNNAPEKEIIEGLGVD